MKLTAATLLYISSFALAFPKPEPQPTGTAGPISWHDVEENVEAAHASGVQKRSAASFTNFAHAERRQEHKPGPAGPIAQGPGGHTNFGPDHPVQAGNFDPHQVAQASHAAANHPPNNHDQHPRSAPPAGPPNAIPTGSPLGGPAGNPPNAPPSGFPFSGHPDGPPPPGFPTTFPDGPIPEHFPKGWPGDKDGSAFAASLHEGHPLGPWPGIWTAASQTYPSPTAAPNTRVHARDAHDGHDHDHEHEHPHHDGHDHDHPHHGPGPRGVRPHEVKHYGLDDGLENLRPAKKGHAGLK